MFVQGDKNLRHDLKEIFSRWRVRVERERLELWLIDFDSLASAGAKALGFGDSPRAIVDGRVWLLGTRCFGDRTRDVFLVRGATWRDGRQLLADSVRLATSTCPLILGPNLIPNDPAWTSNGRVVLSMSEFDWFGNDFHTLLTRISLVVAEHDRPAAVARGYGAGWLVS